jgi:hypothetical protein
VDVNKTVFSQGQKVEKRGLETGLTTVGANSNRIFFAIIADSSLSFGGGGDSMRQDAEISCEEGLQTK